MQGKREGECLEPFAGTAEHLDFVEEIMDGTFGGVSVESKLTVLGRACGEQGVGDVQEQRGWCDGAVADAGECERSVLLWAFRVPERPDGSKGVGGATVVSCCDLRNGGNRSSSAVIAGGVAGSTAEGSAAPRAALVRREVKDRDGVPRFPARIVFQRSALWVY